MFQKIPTVTKFLLIANILIFLVTVFIGGDKVEIPMEDGTRKEETLFTLNTIFGLYFFLTNHFHFFQFFTYMFCHGNWEHLFFNMFALWMFGSVVERVWGPKKFLFYFIACGIGAGMFQAGAQFFEYLGLFGRPTLNLGATVGASGAIYAILLAFGMIFPEERIFIFPLPIPIKAKWFVIFYAGLELFLAISTTGDGVAHIAHLGGMVFGFFMIRYWRKHPTAGYGKSQGEQFFENLRSSWEKRSKKSADKASWGGSRTSTGNPDWDYNARKQREQEEIDRILDKIRKNGYDSLTSEEKRKLFEQSKKG